MMDKGILRIIDANLNRAREGLRVVEELVRFDLNDSGMSKRLKVIRHEIAGLIDEIFDSSLLISARDSHNDVGLAIRVDTECCRTDKTGIIKANMKRSQEAIRVLEEFIKIEAQRHVGAGFKPACSKPAQRQEETEETSRKMKALRYQAYELEQDVLQAFGRNKSIKGLYLILDYWLLGEKIWDRDYVGEIITAGVDAVQLRVKNIVQQHTENISDSKLIMLGNMLREITEKADILLIINDKIDIALAIGADGVHLGQDDISIDVARSLMGRRIIGISTHSLAQAQQPAKNGADYIGIGPVYGTTTKHDAGQPLGCKIIHEICKTVNLPIVAIGGINEDNLTQVIETGAHGIAVASAILKAPDPVAVVKRIHEKLA
ncbi:thiamine phosphate synthase [Candidatus Desantisbacteria bacterium]|nr:thiamine phosphate synthase [Candidatus Desantisbacteria bacterium]